MNLTNTLFAAGLIATLASTPAAADKTAGMTELLQSRLGNIPVTKPVETPAKGVYQTSFGSKIAYLTGDGRYVIIGDMIDLQNQQNLSEVARRQISKGIIDQVDKTNLAVFPSTSGETKKVLNVFTDTSCPYCKKLHDEVPELQKAGIEVRYFPFPRGGARGPGYADLKKVWCADDKAAAMDIAKDVEAGSLPAGDCKQSSFVDRGYALGNQLGVSGTPALFVEDGKKIEGYVPADKLIPMLLN